MRLFKGGEGFVFVEMKRHFGPEWENPALVAVTILVMNGDKAVHWMQNHRVYQERYLEPLREL